MKRVVIYHDNCQDGFGAAFVFFLASKRYGYDFDFIPGRYGEPLPDVVNGAIVYLADFSYKMFTMKVLLDKAASVVVLDHHKSAMDELILGEGNLVGTPNFDGSHCTNEKSGALIAWEYWFPNEPAPLMIQHISDRDLWKFELLHTKEFCEYLFSQPYQFYKWDEIMEDARIGKSRYEEMLATGAALLSAKDAVTKDLFKLSRIGCIDGNYIPIVNAPYHYASGLGDLFKSEFKASASYFIDENMMAVFSLRSREGDGLDVQEIAKKFGGGGHKHAAGFKVSIDQLTNILRYQ